MRRRNAQALFIAGVLCSKINAPQILEKLIFSLHRPTSRHGQFLRLEFSYTQYGSNDPITAMSRVLNNLFVHFDFEYIQDVLFVCYASIY